MSLKDFQEYILGLMGMNGINSYVWFDMDTDDDGNPVRYIADIPDENIRFIARPNGLSMTVRFGSGHQSTVSVPSRYCSARC